MPDDRAEYGDDLEQKTVCRTIEEAWDDALSARGLERVVLVLLMLFMTVPFAPLWMLLIPIERAGYYGSDGYKL